MSLSLEEILSVTFMLEDEDCDVIAAEEFFLETLKEAANNTKSTATREGESVHSVLGSFGSFEMQCFTSEKKSFISFL